MKETLICINPMILMLPSLLSVEVGILMLRVADGFFQATFEALDFAKI